ncbi:hypothetical protein, partial [Clostridium perfringens]
VVIELDDDTHVILTHEEIKAGATMEPSGTWLHVMGPREGDGRRLVTTYPACRIRQITCTIDEPAKPAPHRTCM